MMGNFVTIFAVGIVAVAILAVLKAKLGYLPLKKIALVGLVAYLVFGIYQIIFALHFFHATDDSSSIAVSGGEIFYGATHSIDSEGNIHIQKGGLFSGKKIDLTYKTNPEAYDHIRFLASALARYDQTDSRCVPSGAHTYHRSISWFAGGKETEIAFQSDCRFELWRDIWELPYIPFQLFGVPVASGRIGRDIQMSKISGAIEDEIPDQLWSDSRRGIY